MFQSFLKLLGYLLGVGFSILLFVLFLVAYFHPSKSCLVMVNVFGEADFELVLWFFLLFIIFFSMFLELKHYKKGVKK